MNPVTQVRAWPLGDSFAVQNTQVLSFDSTYLQNKVLACCPLWSKMLPPWLDLPHHGTKLCKAFQPGYSVPGPCLQGKSNMAAHFSIHIFLWLYLVSMSINSKLLEGRIICVLFLSWSLATPAFSFSHSSKTECPFYTRPNTKCWGSRGEGDMV